MISAEARHREVFITPEGESTVHTYVIPEKVFYYIEKTEGDLTASKTRIEELESALVRDELEIAQRVIMNLRSDRGGSGYCCLSDSDSAGTTGSDFWKECAIRIIRALRHLDEKGNAVSKDRLGHLDDKSAESLKSR